MGCSRPCSVEMPLETRPAQIAGKGRKGSARPMSLRLASLFEPHSFAVRPSVSEGTSSDRVHSLGFPSGPSKRPRFFEATQGIPHFRVLPSSAGAFRLQILSHSTTPPISGPACTTLKRSRAAPCPSGWMRHSNASPTRVALPVPWVKWPRPMAGPLRYLTTSW